MAKDELEKTIQMGIHGRPELRRAERQIFLGEMRERVLKVLTFAQLEEEGSYPEFRQALQDPRAKYLIISRKVPLERARDYIRTAREQGISFVTTDSPEYRGKVGLVIASDDAVDEPDIFVETRQERLKAAGIPRALIEAKGAKICSRCRSILQEHAPGELPHYRSLSCLDRLLRKRCASCNLPEPILTRMPPQKHV